MSTAILTTSWDDGTPEDLSLAHLLAEYGFLGTFYATTGPAGRRTLDDKALRELVALGHEIGNHGRSHRPFPELTSRELLNEVEWAEKQIRLFADPGPVVAAPRGLISRSVVRTLNANGYLVRTAPILGHRRQRKGLVIPSAHFYPHSRLRTYRHLVRRRSLPATAYLRAWSRSRMVRERFQDMISESHSRRLVLHIWGHSREVETLGLWDDLEFLLEEAKELGFQAATNGGVLRMDVES